ncbi:MAG TPA: hypothetical protein VN767_20480 [Streptosporangiaceae bacterium]|nr:hypothetical protein [Streptosporangiaceae bacterium]
MARIPVLWLCGPPGIGKSTVGWELYGQLADAGIETGYVDIDQLGMCYPEPPADPGRYRLKAGNLGAVVANYQAAGASCVVVSGVVDPVNGAHADLVPRGALTICRLRADRDELSRRIRERGDQGYPVDEILAEADALDQTDFADLCLDTGGLSVAETTRLVRDRLAGWPSLPDPSDEDDTPPHDREATVAGGRILLLCGPTGAGKSTIGWEIYVRTVGAGSAAAYLDLGQVGFCRPGQGNLEVKARNLASVWQNYRAAGAQCLVAVGPVENGAVAEAYAAALPDASLTLARLHAEVGELTRRIMLRGQGSSWNEPGDPLGGQPAEKLLEVAANAAEDAEALDQAKIDATRIDTTRLTVGQAADEIVAETGWLKLADGDSA